MYSCLVGAKRARQGLEQSNNSEGQDGIMRIINNKDIGRDQFDRISLV
jgi:hypothetical protein